MSRHAAAIIVQFMAANSGTTRTREDNADSNEEGATTHTLPQVDLALERVRGILDRMSVAQACIE